MSDAALNEPAALPALALHDSDAPPSSAGRLSVDDYSGPVEQSHEVAISDELKARLDQVFYSDVGNRGRINSSCVQN